MKIKLAIYQVTLSGLLLLILFSCKKESVVPTITTAAPSEITSTSVTSGGSVTSDGGSAVTSKGVCWSINHNPTIADNKTTDGTGSGSYTSSLTGLLVNTTLYLRAYATNEIGTAYGNEISFIINMACLNFSGILLES